MTSPLGTLRPLDVAQAPAPNGNGNGHHEQPNAQQGVGWMQLYHAWTHRMLAELSGPELRAMLYILRNTKGWKGRQSDHISQSQFLHGKDGDPLDQGCGLHSKNGLKAALAGLQEKGYIRIAQQVSARGKTLSTSYTLLLAPPDGSSGDPTQPPDGSCGDPLMGHGMTHDGSCGDPSIAPDGSCGDPLMGHGMTPQKKGKKNVPKETLKETPKETLSGAGAPPSAGGEMGISHPEGGTERDGHRPASSPQGDALGETRRPEGEKRPQGQAAAPRVMTPTKTDRSLETCDDDPDEEWAPKVFLREARGFRESDPANRRTFWWPRLAPLLERLGRPDFVRWARSLRGDPWLQEDRDRWATRSPQRWMEVVDTWLALPPQQQDMSAAQRQAEREQRERGKRRGDTGRVNNNDVPDDERLVCLSCNARPDQVHQQWCQLVKLDIVALGSAVLPEHGDEGWYIPVVKEAKARQKQQAG